MKKIAIRLSSIAVHLVSGLLAAFIVLYLQDWFGMGDTKSYVFWTLPLSFGLAVFGKTILDIFSTQKRVLRILFIFIASGLIAFGWLWGVYLILGPWINTFSIAVFYLWFIGTFFQLNFIDLLIKKREKITIKRFSILVIGLPLVLIICVASIYGASILHVYLTRPIPETYLIPSDFEGMFKVISGQECGISPKVENGRRVLEIPDNGVLIIKPTSESGIIDHRYYLVDDNGKRIEIEKNYSNETIPSPNVRLLGSGRSSRTINSLKITFKSEEFLVNQDTVYKYNYKYEQQLDSLVYALIEACMTK